MCEKCKEGMHPLIDILSLEKSQSLDVSKTIRWCSDCGAIVIDAECDGRLYPGRYMKMRMPKASKEYLHEA